MKKIINSTLIVIYFACSISFAQNRKTQFATEVFVYSADVYDTRNLYDPATPENYDGTPYYVNDFLFFRQKGHSSAFFSILLDRLLVINLKWEFKIRRLLLYYPLHPSDPFYNLSDHCTTALSLT